MTPTDRSPLATKLTAERDRYAAGQQQFEADRDAARADADGKIETLEADAYTEQEASRATAQSEGRQRPRRLAHQDRPSQKRA